MRDRRRRSRSHSRGRVNSRRVSRSRSRSPRRGRDGNRRGAIGSEFSIPYRCLVPKDSTGALIGKSGSLLKDLVSKTGADVHVPRPEENPRGLDDRVMTLQGSVGVKDSALSWVLARLRDHLRKSESDRLVFVCLIPDVAASWVVGNRGTTVRELSGKSGAEIDVGREVIKGTKDVAVTLKGRTKDVESAVSRMHALLQDYADNGKLTQRDFAYCKPVGARPQPVADSKPTPRVMVDLPLSFDSGIPVRLSVTEQEADWLVSDAVIEKVKAVEDKYSCLISLEAPISPPQTDADEIAQIAASTYARKADACEALLRLLHTNFKDRQCGILLDAKISSFVIGPKGASINSISDHSGATLKLQRIGDFARETVNLMTVSGGLENQAAALRMLVAKIDLSAPSLNEHGPRKSIILHLNASDVAIVDSQLVGLRKKNPETEIRVLETGVALAGPARAITSLVSQLLSLDIAHVGEDRDRHPGEDDEVDYS